MLTRPPRIVVVCGVATALSLLGDQALYALLPIYFESLGLMPVQVGILLSANRWIRLLTNTLAERVLHRIGPGPPFLAALAAGAGVTGIYAVSDSFVFLLLARLCWGLCWSFIRHISVMALARETEMVVRGQMMGYYNGISRIGSIGGIVLGGVLFDWLGYGETFLVFFICSMLAVPIGLAAGLPSRPAPPLRSPRKTGSDRPFALLVAGFAVGAAGPGVVMSTLGFVLLSRYGEDISLGPVVIGVATFNGLLLGSRWLLDTTGAPLLGALVDRVGIARGSVTGFAVGILALGSILVADVLWLLMAGVVAFFVCGTTLHTVLAGEASKRGSGPFARFVTASDVGAAAGPLSAWLALEWLGDVNGLFVIAAALYGLGLVAALTAFERA